MVCSRRKGTSVPITAAVWSRRFSSGGKRSMRAASTACTVAGHLNGRQGLRQAIGPRLAHQHAGLHQRAHALLQEEGIAFGARDQELRERCQAGIVPKQGLEHLGGTGWRQRVEAELRVVGLTAPAVLILGAVVDQEQQTRRRQALDEAVEQGLGLRSIQCRSSRPAARVAPGFRAAGPLERIERALAALGRIEPQNGLSSGRASRSASRAGSVSWRAVQRQHLPGDLGLYGARVIAALNWQ